MLSLEQSLLIKGEEHCNKYCWKKLSFTLIKKMGLDNNINKLKRRQNNREKVYGVPISSNLNQLIHLIFNHIASKENSHGYKMVRQYSFNLKVTTKH